jgi:hypothetical protein
MKNIDYPKELRKMHVGNYNMVIIHDAADEIERLRAERDEARREVCQMKGTVRWNHYFPHFDPKGYAKNRGWDCHKDYK